LKRFTPAPPGLLLERNRYCSAVGRLRPPLFVCKIFSLAPRLDYNNTDSALSLVPIYEASKGTEPMEKSQVIKRSVVVGGHKTSVSLEEPFWKGLKEIASKRRQSLSELVGSIDTGRAYGNLSSAVRLFVLKHYQERVPSEHIAPPAGDSSARISH
jgi:predicted DNA-binding ribbon-helix-helix protein